MVQGRDRPPVAQWLSTRTCTRTGPDSNPPRPAPRLDSSEESLWEASFWQESFWEESFWDESVWEESVWEESFWDEEEEEDDDGEEEEEVAKAIRFYLIRCATPPPTVFVCSHFAPVVC